jgi:hypothetical protein
MADCPKCHSELGNATYCGCGWRRRSMREQFREREVNHHPLGYQQCEWESNGERCKFPGSMSTNTHSGGPYFCRLHFACDDPAYGSQVVEGSRDFHRETTQEAIDRLTAEARKSLAERGLQKRKGESLSSYLGRLRAWRHEKAANGVLKRSAA